MKKAITLSELLITITIIGVISLLTIPTLINNINKHIWTTRLHKTYTSLDGALKAWAMEHVRYGKEPCTKLFPYAINSNGTKYGGYTKYDETMGKSFVKEYFKNAKICGIDTDKKCFSDIRYLINGNVDRGGGDTPWNVNTNASFYKFMLADGESVLMYWIDPIIWGHSINTIGAVYVDINGESKPNTIGRDIFFLLVDNDCSLKARGTADECPADGNSCSARIIEDGWKMNY